MSYTQRSCFHVVCLIEYSIICNIRLALRGERMIPGGSGTERHGVGAYDYRRGLHCSGDTQAAYCRPVLSSGSLGARLRSGQTFTPGLGHHARLLARACVHVPRRGCRTRLPVLETAHPLLSCRTTGRSPRARGHPPWRAIHRKFLVGIALRRCGFLISLHS